MGSLLPLLVYCPAEDHHLRFLKAETEAEVKIEWVPPKPKHALEACVPFTLYILAAAVH